VGNLPTVENFTPQVLWTTIYGMLALCLLFMIVYKVYDAIHTIIERRHKKKESEQPSFAEEVSQKVIDKLEPRFKEIEKNLAQDKKRLDNHESFIADMRQNSKEIRDGLAAICKFMLVISTYGNIGNNEKVEDAKVELQKYLAERL
jgi:hypothetical protein